MKVKKKRQYIVRNDFKAGAGFSENTILHLFYILLQSEALKFQTTGQYIGIVLDCNAFNASNVEESGFKNINRPVLLYVANELCK